MLKWKFKFKVNPDCILVPAPELHTRSGYINTCILPGQFLTQSFSYEINYIELAVKNFLNEKEIYQMSITCSMETLAMVIQQKVECQEFGIFSGQWHKMRVERPECPWSFSHWEILQTCWENKGRKQVKMKNKKSGNRKKMGGKCGNEQRILTKAFNN